jgi:hypothetical protein
MMAHWFVQCELRRRPLARCRYKVSLTTVAIGFRAFISGQLDSAPMRRHRSMRDVLAATIIGSGAGTIIPGLGDFFELRKREQQFESHPNADRSGRGECMLRRAAYRHSGRDRDADAEWIADQDAGFNQDANPIANACLLASGYLDAASYRRRSAT